MHARTTAAWKGTRAAVLAIIGLIVFRWNLIGVNPVLNGLRSYAGSCASPRLLAAWVIGIDVIRFSTNRQCAPEGTRTTPVNAAELP